MPKINLLSSNIFNRIAAGEVVERPYSVVKELVENSIDAGATKINVNIVEGGKTSIVVSDNGCGIFKDELHKALLPHATSKISSIEDLDNITSLGFRGEALASIASVSKITIKSKTTDEEIGASIYSEGGVIGDVKEDAAVNGTEITVNNLFYNTPAREKFLKTDKGEESDISSIISKFILGNPNISFKYTINNQTVYQSFGDGLESSMIQIYGTNIIKDCFYIENEKNGIKINGYIGKHYFTKPNRTYQTVFINGRYVINQTISSAISNAYSSYLMKRQYPFYVLNVSLPTETVDVNVHPNKTDVRFSNNQVVYGSIYSVISKVLDGSSEALNIVLENKEDIHKENIQTHDNNKISNEIKYDYVRHNGNNKHISKLETYNFDNILVCDSGTKDKSNESNSNIDVFAENKAYLEKLEKEKQTLNQNFEKTDEIIKIENELKYVGQVLKTYMIFEDGLDVYLIDQHAAHERLLFDKFSEQMAKRSIEIQPLLIPFIIDLNSNEADFILSKIEVLKEMGIEIENFGRNAFKISSLPVCFADINLNNFFNEILSDLNELKLLNINDLLKERLAQKACKAAIKSGYVLTDSDIIYLKDKLQNNMGLKCPHGRPVAVKITRSEIDKWFKRIV